MTKIKLRLSILTAIILTSVLLSLATFNPQPIVAARSAPQIDEKLAMLGKAVRMNVAGHMSTVFITDYDLASDSWYGEAHRNFSMNSGENPPVVQSVRGLRQYPYTARPDYSFQFCYPPGDKACEQALIDIANANEANRGPLVKPSDGRQAPTGTTPEERKKKKKP